MVSLISLIIVLALIGFVLWLIITYIPIPVPFKNVIVVIVVIVVILYLISFFGLTDLPTHYHR